MDKRKRAAEMLSESSSEEEAAKMARNHSLSLGNKRPVDDAAEEDSKGWKLMVYLRSTLNYAAIERYIVRKEWDTRKELVWAQANKALRNPSALRCNLAAVDWVEKQALNIHCPPRGT